MTVRDGVAEVVSGDEPLPGTPPTAATTRIDSTVWKQLGLKQQSLASVLA